MRLFRTRTFRTRLLYLLCATLSWLAGALTAGCAAPRQDRDALNVGYQALQAGKYDDALARAEAYLSKHPQGEGAAEAHYLRGRVFEQRVAGSQRDAQANLQAARNAYIAALELKPNPTLEANVRASVGNVAYWQDDYATAAQQWQRAYEITTDPPTRAYILYRIGLSQQRLGQFDAADRTFAMVQEQYPNTDAASRAKVKQGHRGFLVQLATFANSGGADQAVLEIRKSGVTPQRVTNPKGQHVVSVGPVPTYQQAQALKGRFLDRYPDALILP